VSTTARRVAEPFDAPFEDNLHLSAVLEAQPITLMRIGSDGRVLAVNDAGLAVIGAERLDQVLGTSLTALLPNADHQSFLTFIEHVAAGHRGSVEVTLNAFTGHHYTMLVHATPHPGAPDGMESALVTLLDITDSRRLEASLVEAMARKSDGDARLAEIAELEKRVHGLEQDRDKETERHAAELRTLTQALEQGRQVNEEQIAQLKQFGDLEERFAELSRRHDASELTAQAQARDLEHSRSELDAARAESAAAYTDADAARATAEAARADADAARAEAAQLRADLEKEIATGRTLLESAHAEAARYQADVASLREELDRTIRTEAEQTVRSQRQAELNAARLTAIEAALAAAQSARDTAIARAACLAEAGSRLARQLESEVGAMAVTGISAGELGERLEAMVPVDRELPMALMVAAPDARSAVGFEIVQQAIDAIASDRRTVMSGRMVLEIAPVDVDEGASRSRGHMRSGAYLLLALHVMGTDAAQGFAPELFESTESAAWANAGPRLFIAFEALRLARGCIWLAREGASDVVFELYVPRVEDQFTGSTNDD